LLKISVLRVSFCELAHFLHLCAFKSVLFPQPFIYLIAHGKQVKKKDFIQHDFGQ